MKRVLDLLIYHFLQLNTSDVKRITLRNVHNAQLEFVWTLAPTFILVLLALPSLYFLYQLELMFFDLYDGDLVTVKVIGSQWFWSYELLLQTASEVEPFIFDAYLRASTDLALSELRLLETDHPLILPAFTPIRFIVTATDVLHSWAIPSLGVKIDACPGRLNLIFSFINREGEFYGQCSEICGVQHGFMPIDIIALDPEAV